MRKLRKDESGKRTGRLRAEWALPLLAALNGGWEFSEPCKPVVTLLTSLQRLETIRLKLVAARAKLMRKEVGSATILFEGRYVGWQMYRFGEAALDQLNEEGIALFPQINRILERYHFFPQVHVVTYDSLLFHNEEAWYPKRKVELEESTCVDMLLMELREGHIDHYRRCLTCNRWLKAEAHHQKYCTDACRIRASSRAESFKTRRRDYMKRYRRDEKERERKALKAARGGKK